MHLPPELPDPTAALPAERLATDIEVSTLIAPRKPVGSSPDDDPTGVRALLSGLPEPDPMPAYLIERISASLAAEQARRAVPASSSVTPLLAPTRRRRGRLVFAVAGAAAAAAVLIGVVGNSLLTTSLTTSARDSAASAMTSGAREAGGATPPSADDKAVAGRVATPASIQIRSSEVRYTEAGFAAQARALSRATFGLNAAKAAPSISAGKMWTPGGLADCLSAIGADGAQLVRADLAFYEGQPAVIIVATTDGIPTAYAVGTECSQAGATLLRPATPLS